MEKNSADSRARRMEQTCVAGREDDGQALLGVADEDDFGVHRLCKPLCGLNACSSTRDMSASQIGVMQIGGGSRPFHFKS